MRSRTFPGGTAATLALALASLFTTAQAATVSRLTPPSELFASGQAAPVIARFLPGQRFDLQATVQPDPGQTITSFEFRVDGKLALQPIYAGSRLIFDPRPTRARKVTETGPAETCINPDTGKTKGGSGCVLVAGLPSNTAVLTERAYSTGVVGVHTFTVTARQSNGAVIEASGNFEIVDITAGNGQKAKNIILLVGDGMGSSHRTAARIMAKGYAQGKAKGKLAMDTFPATAMVMTASLNSIVTDSAPGMANYVSGNKAANNEEGVFPDDTLNAFDNPRIEYLAEYLHTLQGKSLGIVTTSDVFDATPAANAIHTSSRGNGTGIVDQYLDDRHLTGLTVLMGGGRKWFLPNASASTSPQPVNGSQRVAKNDYVLPDDLVAGWGATKGAIDPQRDLIADFQAAGYRYAPTKSALDAAFAGPTPDKLLGLFAYSNMNVAFDKINGRRGDRSVVDAFGFPDQPMLDEMTDRALQVLSKNPKGFVAMIEAASIDKQSHLMDTDRWILEVLEFDRAVAVAQRFAREHPDTLVIVTADHECSGAAIIGAATATAAQLQTKLDGGQSVVGVYDDAKFPKYTLAEDGYPVSTVVDHKMLIGYGANADRYETWLPTAFPTKDSQQPFPPSQSPANPNVRNQGTGFLITGQVPGDQAVHTATDIPLSAYGRGAMRFGGTIDNTDVFFQLARIAVSGE
ncbi:alkaline phosphatase [Tahibacter amnicola]|uniref:Alkaline phosphatase n=1 Tax=Tahibacter amnicola TaxID=2976241 RepID=A0ABY6BDT5_9GAMM|nr:alkaline phosphatase [Tahibacter amnicola]UXI68198.1 alkaline phosphatase [Tahibacter amnicola]